MQIDLQVLQGREGADGVRLDGVDAARPVAEHQLLEVAEAADGRQGSALRIESAAQLSDCSNTASCLLRFPVSSLQAALLRTPGVLQAYRPM